MKYKVIKYNAVGDFHVCDGEDGNREFIDLRIAGRMPNETNDSLIGRTFDISEKHTYCYIANKLEEVLE